MTKFFFKPGLLKILIFIKFHLKLLSQYFYDYLVYSSHSVITIETDLKQIEGKIIASYHVLEKGLSHPTPKKCFSLAVVRSLISLINTYEITK